jgi:hypothetical protein
MFSKYEKPDSFLLMIRSSNDENTTNIGSNKTHIK